MEEWADAVADWSDAQGIPITLVRCPCDGWLVEIHLSDTSGLFIATADFLRRRVEQDKPSETVEDYRVRVRAALNRACAKARSARIRKLNGKIAHKRAA